MLIRFLFSFWLIVWNTIAFCQFRPGISYDMYFPTTKSDFSYTVAAFNANETFSFYEVSTRLNPVVAGFSIRNSGSRFESKQKWILGYSLEIAYRQFSTKNRMAFSSSSTQNNDSIIRNYHGFVFNTSYKSLLTSHFLDVHFNPTAKIKITNSFGLSLSAILKTESRNTNVPGKGVESNYPVLKLIYQPQITEQYEGISVSYFATIDCFSWELFRTKVNGLLSEQNGILMSTIRFNGIGVRIMPQLNVKKPLDPVLDF